MIIIYAIESGPNICEVAGNSKKKTHLPCA